MTEFNLSEELDKADWNIEDVWDMKKPEAREVVDKILKEFIMRLKESLITDDISIYDYRKEMHTNAELQKAIEEQIGRIMKEINKLAGDKLK